MQRVAAVDRAERRLGEALGPDLMGPSCSDEVLDAAFAQDRRGDLIAASSF